jgi:large repetitive protein
MKKLYFTGILFTAISIVSISWKSAPERVAGDLPVRISSVNNGNAATFFFNQSTVVDDAITISGYYDITNPRVYIDGFQPGDILSYPGDFSSEIDAFYNSSSGMLSFYGTAQPAEWQEIFRKITFASTSSNKSPRTIKFMLADRDPLVLDGKIHFYQYVYTDGDVNWSDARSAASTYSYLGMPGYLATATSWWENWYIMERIGGNSWLAASDEDSEGSWYWKSGPEEGTPLTFSNWAPGEPNNVWGIENYVMLYTGNAEWNDAQNLAGSFVPGYMVEYGGYENDIESNILYTRVIKNKPDAPVITYISDDAATPNDFITSDNTILINGTAVPYSTVNVSRSDIGSIGSTTADEEGNWSFDYSETVLNDGTYTFFATTAIYEVTSIKSDSIRVFIDATKPEVIVSTGTTKARGSFAVTFTFNEPVENFLTEKIMLTNATASQFKKISATEYTILVTPITDKEVSVQLVADAASDTLGNGNSVSNLLKTQTVFSAEMGELFPVPATNVLNVKFKGVVSEKCKVMLVSMSGTTVYNKQHSFNNNTLQINVSGLMQGTYTLYIIAKDKTYHKQFIIAR